MKINGKQIWKTNGTRTGESLTTAAAVADWCVTRSTYIYT